LPEACGINRLPTEARGDAVEMTKRKALGQHFLASRAVLQKIITVISPQKNELIIEIGAGKGALTAPLAGLSGRVIAIEKDRALIPYLLKLRKDNLTVIEGDVLKIDFDELLAKESRPDENVKLVGNLPYSISTPLLFRILEKKKLVQECVFLLQKEVAERLSARPRSKAYAPISILFQIDYEIHLHFPVSPGSFTPPPRVISALVSLKKRLRPLVLIRDERPFRNFLRLCFASRRKTLLNNLKAYPVALPAIKDVLRRLSLPENARAEQVPIELFAQLFHSLQDLR
jgi:16S rRNA (adenine1518-N6/adenine1519-N6)-dimethyltransferase